MSYEGIRVLPSPEVFTMVLRGATMGRSIPGGRGPEGLPVGPKEPLTGPAIDVNEHRRAEFPAETKESDRLD